MQRITRTEVQWIIEALDRRAVDLALAAQNSTTNVERQLAKLRTDQLRSLADKLTDILERGGKRIDIPY